MVVGQEIPSVLKTPGIPCPTSVPLQTLSNAPVRITILAAKDAVLQSHSDKANGLFVFDSSDCMKIGEQLNAECKKKAIITSLEVPP
jgi:hypothetical protein